METNEFDDDTTNQKNKKIAIFCAPLIHVNHAPSNRVLEISATLKQRYGYELKVFAGGTFSYSVNAAEANYTTNAMVIPNDQKSIEHSGISIPIWTSYKDDGQYKKHIETFENIMDFNLMLFCYLATVIQFKNCFVPKCLRC